MKRASESTQRQAQRMSKRKVCLVPCTTDPLDKYGSPPALSVKHFRDFLSEATAYRLKRELVEKAPDPLLVSSQGSYAGFRPMERTGRPHRMTFGRPYNSENVPLGPNTKEPVYVPVYKTGLARKDTLCVSMWSARIHKIALSLEQLLPKECRTGSYFNSGVAMIYRTDDSARFPRGRPPCKRPVGEDEKTTSELRWGLG